MVFHPRSNPVHPRVKSSVIQQLVAFVLTLLVLDHGLLLYCCLIAVLAYWLVVALIVTRRPSMPTPTDIKFVAFGFLAIFLGVAIIGPKVWESLEYSSRAATFFRRVPSIPKSADRQMTPDCRSGGSTAKHRPTICIPDGHNVDYGHRAPTMARRPGAASVRNLVENRGWAN